MNKNVILYPRVSWSKQSKYWESLDVQEQECRAFCERNDYQVLAVFKEQFTWTKDKRPKLLEALDFIKNSELKIDYVIVHKVDRVSRWGIVIHENFKQQFKALWVTVKDTFWIIAEEKTALSIDWIDTSKYNWAKDITNKLTENVTVMMSENERNTILQRMLWQSIKNGMRWYKTRDADFWYKNKKIMTPLWRKTIQVENKEESLYIKRMFELRARWDLTDNQITNEINLMGFKSREKTKWNSNKTEAIWIIWGNPLNSKRLQIYIKSPIYAWIICEEWTWNKPIKAPYDWLVSVDLWNKANKWKYKINIVSDEEINIEYYKRGVKLEKAPAIKKIKSYKPDYPFSKVLMCPICWWHLTTEKSRSKSWKYHHYYSCRGKNWIKHTNYSLRRDIVNDEVVMIFTKLNLDSDGFKLFEYISRQVFKKRELEYKNQNIEREKRLKELNIKQKSMSKAIVKLIDYPDLLQVQNLELQWIKKEITELQSQNEKNWNKIWLNKFLRYSKKILTHLDKLALKRENPEIIQLIFELVFDGKIKYEKLKSHTPIISQFSALNTKKDFQQNWKSSLNPSWWVTKSESRTLEEYIIKSIDRIEKWQYTIEKNRIL